MIDILRNYYNAWETDNFELLMKVISPTIYGIRTYQEEKLFTITELKNAFRTNNVKQVSITDYEEYQNIIKCSLIINNVQVSAKITFKDGKIYKVYEEKTSSLKRIKCIVSYDGSGYSGFQKQVNALSIQGTIETAITKAFKVKESISIYSSGRTDKGVHAINQVFHFDIETKIDPPVIAQILNTYLPSSIHIKTSVEMEHTFHSRYDVLEKEYMYKINTKMYDPIQRNYEWYIKEIDLDIFNAELRSIIGTFDFSSFTKNVPNHSNIRTIFDAYITVKDDYVYIHIKGSGFLRYMVRNIIGAIYAISINKLNYSIKELLELKDVNLIREKAPASGLYLYNVKY